MTKDTERAPRRANISTIADQCHVSRGRASTILKLANMRKDRAGTYLFAVACENILSAIDLDRSIGHQAGGDESALSSGVAGNVAGAINVKALFDTQRTRKLTLEIDKAEGRLIQRAQVIEAARDIAAHIRAGLAGVGAKVANDLATAKDASVAQTLVDGAIHDALLKLCDLGAYMLGELQE